MPGTVHIFRLDPQHKPSEKLEPQYQANYDAAGNAYSKAYTERKLKELLHYSLGLSEEQVMQAVHDLRQSGKFTVADVELSSEEIAALGLEQQPTDF